MLTCLLQCCCCWVVMTPSAQQPLHFQLQLLSARTKKSIQAKRTVSQDFQPLFCPINLTNLSKIFRASIFHNILSLNFYFSCANALKKLNLKIFRNLMFKNNDFLLIRGLRFKRNQQLILNFGWWREMMSVDQGWTWSNGGSSEAAGMLCQLRGWSQLRRR